MMQMMSPVIKKKKKRKKKETREKWTGDGKNTTSNRSDIDAITISGVDAAG
jgi:hypothetical protein